MTTSIKRSVPVLRLPDVSQQAVFGASWLLVMSVGCMPLVKTYFHRMPSVTMPTVIVFFLAVCTAALLRQHYSWVGLAMHIYGQLAIWLSLFCISLVLVLRVTGRS